MRLTEAPPQRRAAQWRFPAALIVLVMVWLSMLLLGGGWLDQWIYEALYAGHRPLLAVIAHGFTALGDPQVLITAVAASALWLWWAGRHRLALVLIAVTMLGRGLGELQKNLVSRPRPALEPHLVRIDSFSFPSGHAASSMIFYVTFALALTAGTRWHRAAVAGAIVLSLLIGLSRVMLGVHWPSDVIGGWSFGMLWVLLTLHLARRWLETSAA